MWMKGKLCYVWRLFLSSYTICTLKYDTGNIPFNVVIMMLTNSSSLNQMQQTGGTQINRIQPENQCCTCYTDWMYEKPKTTHYVSKHLMILRSKRQHRESTAGYNLLSSLRFSLSVVEISLVYLLLCGAAACSGLWLLNIKNRLHEWPHNWVDLLDFFYYKEPKVCHEMCGPLGKINFTIIHGHLDFWGFWSSITEILVEFLMKHCWSTWWHTVRTHLEQIGAQWARPAKFLTVQPTNSLYETVFIDETLQYWGGIDWVIIG